MPRQIDFRIQGTSHLSRAPRTPSLAPAQFWRDTNIKEIMTMNEMTIGKCPFGGNRIGGAQGSKPTLEDWWPNRLRVEILHRDGPQANPLPEDFDYAAEFNKLDLDEVKILFAQPVIK